MYVEFPIFQQVFTFKSSSYAEVFKDKHKS